MLLIIGVVLNYFLLICPIMISVQGIFVSEHKKLYFTIRFFGLIKIFSGYIEGVRGGIAVHISQKKAFILTAKSLTNMKGAIIPFIDINIFNLQFLIEIKGEDLVKIGEKGFILSFISNMIFSIVKYYKPFLKLKNTINLYEGQSEFNFYLKTEILLNNLAIILMLLKMLWGKIKNGARKSK